MERDGSSSNGLVLEESEGHARGDNGENSQEINSNNSLRAAKELESLLMKHSDYVTILVTHATKLPVANTLKECVHTLKENCQAVRDENAQTQIDLVDFIQDEFKGIKTLISTQQRELSNAIQTLKASHEETLGFLQTCVNQQEVVKSNSQLLLEVHKLRTAEALQKQRPLDTRCEEFFSNTQV